MPTHTDIAITFLCRSIQGIQVDRQTDIRTQLVGMSTRRIRACTQHGRNRDASHVGLDNSYNVSMRYVAVFTALAPHTYPSGW